MDNTFFSPQNLFERVFDIHWQKSLLWLSASSSALWKGHKEAKCKRRHCCKSTPAQKYPGDSQWKKHWGFFHFRPAFESITFLASIFSKCQHLRCQAPHHLNIFVMKITECATATSGLVKSTNYAFSQISFSGKDTKLLWGLTKQQTNANWCRTGEQLKMLLYPWRIRSETSANPLTRIVDLKPKGEHTARTNSSEISRHCNQIHKQLGLFLKAENGDSQAVQ